MRIKNPKTKKSLSPPVKDELVDIELEKAPNVVLATSKRPLTTKLRINKRFTTMGDRNLPTFSPIPKYSPPKQKIPKKSIFMPLFYGTSPGRTQKFNTLVNGGHVHWTEPNA